MLVHANVAMKYCFHLHRVAFKTATDLDGLAMVTWTARGPHATSTCLGATLGGKST